MAPRGGRRFSEDDDGTFHGEGDGEHCDVCQQEYLGHCPIRSSRCPFEGGEADEEEEEPSHEDDDR